MMGFDQKWTYTGSDTEVGYRGWIQKLDTEVGYRSRIQKLDTEVGYRGWLDPTYSNLLL